MSMNNPPPTSMLNQGVTLPALNWNARPSPSNTTTSMLPTSRMGGGGGATFVSNARASAQRSPTAPSGHTLRAPLLPPVTNLAALHRGAQLGRSVLGDASVRHAVTPHRTDYTPSASAAVLVSSRVTQQQQQTTNSRVVTTNPLKQVAHRTPTAPSGHPNVRVLPLMGLQHTTPTHGVSARLQRPQQEQQHNEVQRFHLQQQSQSSSQQQQQQMQQRLSQQSRSQQQQQQQQQQQTTRASRTPTHTQKYNQRITQAPPPNTGADSKSRQQPSSRAGSSKAVVSGNHQFGAKEILFARLNAKVLSPPRVSTHAESQKGALCISPSTKAYKITRVLQAAIYGGVFEAECYSISDVWYAAPGVKPTPEKPRVALKIMLREMELEHRESLQEDITAEFQFESAMKGHRNVLAYEELWESKSKGIIYVVMPFAEFEDLFEVLRKRAVGFSEGEARWLFRQLIEGVAHLHSKGIGFRDHSLENVLMFRSSDGHTVVPKITDPGQAVRLEFDSNGKIVELEAKKLFGKSFRPPEVYHEPKRYNPVKVDVFCMGWMLFFAVTKRQPFDRTLDTDPHWPLVRDGKFHDLLKYKGNPRLSSELISLLQSMMHPDRHQRPDPRECLQHPWFQRPGTVIEDRTLRGPAPQNRPRQDNSRPQA